MKIPQYTVALLIVVLSTSAVDARTQRCKDSKKATAPTENFQIDIKKGVVTQGSLMWKRCAEGQKLTPKGCTGEAAVSYFDEANTKKSVRFAGYNNWRLPTIDELKTIVEKKCKLPAMNLEVFPNAPNLMLWSKTRVPNRDDKAWVLFSSTGVPIKANIATKAMVRLVRDVK